MVSYFMVVRDVTGLEVASDVQEASEEQIEALKEYLREFSGLRTVSIDVKGVERYFNVENVVEIRLERLE